MFRTLDHYEATSFGVPFLVTLINGAEEEIDDETGQPVGIHIPDLEGLIAAIVVSRVLTPLQLSGAEVKFIRRAIGKTSKDFAEALGLDPATFSRWENGRQSVGEWADKQVRMSALIMLGDRVPLLHIDQKAIVDLRIRQRQPDDQITLTMKRVPAEPTEHNGGRDHDGWTLQEAA